MESSLVFNAPIIMDISSSAPLGSITGVTLFYAGDTRTFPNNHLSPEIGITFPYTTNNYTYQQLLADSENQPFTIWKYRYDIIQCALPDLQIEQPQQSYRFLSDGSIVAKQFTLYEDLDQTQKYSREYRTPVRIDADIGLNIQVVGSAIAPSKFPLTKLRFYIWLDKNTSLTNKLMTGKSEFVFTKPFPLEAKNPYLIKLQWNETGWGFFEEMYE